MRLAARLALGIAHSQDDRRSFFASTLLEHAVRQRRLAGAALLERERPIVGLGLGQPRGRPRISVLRTGLSTRY